MNPVDYRWKTPESLWTACGDNLFMHRPSTDEPSIHTVCPQAPTRVEQLKCELPTVSTTPTMTIEISSKREKGNHQRVEKFGLEKNVGSVHSTGRDALRCDEHKA
jgi:hypothetical protein